MKSSIYHRIILVLTIAIIPTFIFSQIRSVHGIVVNKQREPISGIQVMVCSADTAIIAFKTTGSNGVFKINYTDTALRAQLLIFTSLNYKKTIVSVQNNFRNGDTTVLDSQVYELPNIQVQASPIQIKGDTITYNAATFAGKLDRVIGDVLQKIPGVSVDANGQITYQGEPINKFYIDGKNLLENGYGLATKNVPADMIDKIEIYEKHQPIKILDGLQTSRKAAVNITTKNKYKNKLTTQVNAAVGGKPLIWDASVLGLAIHKNQQALHLYKSNNIGKAALKELQTAPVYGDDGLEKKENLPRFLSALYTANQSMLQQRFVFNETHVASTNILRPLTSKYDIRLQASAGIESLQQQQGANTLLLLPTDTIRIVEDAQFKTQTRKVTATATITANTHQEYFNNKLNIIFDSDREFAGLRTNNSNNNQSLNTHRLQISNHLTTVKKWRNTLVEVQSINSLKRNDEVLMLAPPLFALKGNSFTSELLQQFNQTVFTSHQTISFRKQFKGVQIAQVLGIKYEYRQVTSQIRQADSTGQSEILPDSFQNNSHWRHGSVYSTTQMNYRTGRWWINANVPVIANTINYNPQIQSSVVRSMPIVFNPAATVTYAVAPLQELFITSSKETTFGNLLDVVGGYIVRNNRFISSNQSPLRKTNSINTTVGYSYKNQLSMLFGKVSVSYFTLQTNVLTQNSFDGFINKQLGILTNNNQQTLALSADVGKYFEKTKTTIKAAGGVNFNAGIQGIESALFKYRSNTQSYNVIAQQKWNKYLQTEYTGTLTLQNFQTVGTTLHFTNQLFNSKISVTASTAYRLNFQLVGEVQSGSLAGQRITPLFFNDVVVKWQPKTNGGDIWCSIFNVFNQTNLFDVSANPLGTSITYIQLRPRQILLGYSFKL